jgi:hypothetical protein
MRSTPLLGLSIAVALAGGTAGCGSEELPTTGTLHVVSPHAATGTAVDASRDVDADADADADTATCTPDTMPPACCCSWGDVVDEPFCDSSGHMACRSDFELEVGVSCDDSPSCVSGPDPHPDSYTDASADAACTYDAASPPCCCDGDALDFPICSASGQLSCRAGYGLYFGEDCSGSHPGPCSIAFPPDGETLANASDVGH